MIYFVFVVVASLASWGIQHLIEKQFERDVADAERHAKEVADMLSFEARYARDANTSFPYQKKDLEDVFRANWMMDHPVYVCAQKTNSKYFVFSNFEEKTYVDFSFGTGQQRAEISKAMMSDLLEMLEPEGAKT